MRTLIQTALLVPVLGVALAAAGLIETATAASNVPLGALRAQVELSGGGAPRFGLVEAMRAAEQRAEQAMSFEAIGGGTVRGQVTLNGYATTDADQLAGAGEGAEFAERPAPGMPIVLVNEAGEQFSASTDADGAFEVTGLPAGTWTVQIASSAVPTYYQVSSPNASVTLGDGGSAEVSIGIEPYVRFIRFVGDAVSE